MTLYLSQAITQVVEESETPLFTEYSLYLHTKPILLSGHYKNERIARLPDKWGRTQLRSMIRKLVSARVLAPDKDFKAGVWRSVQTATSADAEDAICIIDPFAYISHLSAMQRYGLTDRSPDALHMTTPSRPLWTALRDQKMADELLRARPNDEAPSLIKIGIADQVRRRSVNLHQSSHPAEPANIAGKAARIAQIGRVFADMLDQPTLCGGIHHVLDCYERHAEQWIGDIVPAIDQFERAIVKVRAGYILSEFLGISNEKIDAWVEHAQRGGSRKLDSHMPYGDRFSEKWMIALNV